MKRSDAQLIVALLRHLDTCRMNEGRGSEEAVADFINAAEGPACNHDYCRDHGSGGCLFPITGDCGAATLNALINATNKPMDVYALQAKYRTRDMNSILYELEQAHLTAAALREELRALQARYTTSQGKQSPIDIDAERFRWILRNLGDRSAMAAVMENPMTLAEHGALSTAGNELKVLIDGVRFRS